MAEENYLELVEQVNASGKLKKGINEVTKELERGNAKIVIAATDASPKEIIMHLPLLAKEKEIPYAEVGSKEELGAAAGVGRSTTAVAVMDAGNAKDLLKSVISELEKSGEAESKESKEKPEEKAEEPAEEAKEESKE